MKIKKEDIKHIANLSMLNLSDEEIDHLSMTIQLKDALKELSEEKLSEFAKDNDIRLCDNREKQEKLILNELTTR